MNSVVALLMQSIKCPDDLHSCTCRNTGKGGNESDALRTAEAESSPWISDLCHLLQLDCSAPENFKGPKSRGQGQPASKMTQFSLSCFKDLESAGYQGEGHSLPDKSKEPKALESQNSISNSPSLLMKSWWRNPVFCDIVSFLCPSSIYIKA